MSNISYAAGRFAFTVEGKFAAFVKKVSGGTTKGEVAKHDLSTSPYQRKHLATIVHEPVTLEIAAGMGEELVNWIKASWDKGFVQKNCELIACDFNYKAKAVRVFQNAYIKKVGIPECDGSNNEASYFTIEIDPEYIRYEKGDDSDVTGEENSNAKKWLRSNFRFEIDGLPCDRIAKIGGHDWEQAITMDQVGASREYTKHPASLTVPDLELTISMADVEKWAEWHKTFVIEGVCDDSAEKTASLTFLGHDLKEELGTIEYEHVGIMSLEPEAMESNSQNVARFKVKLYCEGMKFASFNS